MKTLKYQQDAIGELTEKVIKLLNVGGSRRKVVFEAPTGAGKTVMACQTLANIVDELKSRGDTRFQGVRFHMVCSAKAASAKLHEPERGVFGNTKTATRYV